MVTYSFFNFDLGYVQGMSDLLAPILVNMQDEVAAYWCFKNLMDRIVILFLMIIIFSLLPIILSGKQLPQGSKRNAHSISAIGEFVEMHGPRVA